MTTANADTSNSSESFTPGELAYFQSGGKDTSALETEIASSGSGDGNGGQGTSAPSGDAGDQNASGAPREGQDEGDAGEEDGEEVIVVGKDGKPRATNGRFVPHAALHKERERHKLTKQELEQTRERQARADERLAVLNEILGQADGIDKGSTDKTKIDAPIDPETDPLGALSQALAKIKSLETEIATSKQSTQERETARAMQSAYMNDATRYLAEKPEFKDAYRFLIEGRHRELEAMGMGDANERNRFIANEERQLVAQAFQSRRSPAQMLHTLAVARGFKAQQQQQQQQQQSDPLKKIEQIAQGQRQAGASLSGAGGSSGEGLTAAALADMSEEEFASVAAKLGKSKLRQLLGG